jgi:hypothetical protein
MVPSNRRAPRSWHLISLLKYGAHTSARSSCAFLSLFVVILFFLFQATARSNCRCCWKAVAENHVAGTRLGAFNLISHPSPFSVARTVNPCNLGRWDQMLSPLDIVRFEWAPQTISPSRWTRPLSNDLTKQIKSYKILRNFEVFMSQCNSTMYRNSTKNSNVKPP